MDKIELLKELAVGIRKWRKEARLTMEELAEAAGIDAGYLAHLETVRKTPSLDVLLKLANALNIPVRNLFGNFPLKGRRKDPIELQTRTALLGLKPYQRKDLLEVMGVLRDPHKLESLRKLIIR